MFRVFNGKVSLFSLCSVLQKRKTTNCNPEEKTKEVPEAHPDQSTVKNSYFAEERESAWVKSRHWFVFQKKKNLEKNEALATPPPLNLKHLKLLTLFVVFKKTLEDMYSISSFHNKKRGPPHATST